MVAENGEIEAGVRIHFDFGTALMAGLVITGAAVTLSKKYMMGTCSPGLDQDSDKRCDMAGLSGQPFEKPWIQSLFMFIGMSFCMVLVGIDRRAKKRETTPEGISPEKMDPKQEEEEERRNERWSSTCKRWSPLGCSAACDLIASGLTGTGLITLSATVWLMLRSLRIPFVAVFSRILLGKKLAYFNYIGLLAVVLGVIIVTDSASRAMQLTEKDKIQSFVETLRTSVEERNRILSDPDENKRRLQFMQKNSSHEDLMKSVQRAFLELGVENMKMVKNN